MLSHVEHLTDTVSRSYDKSINTVIYEIKDSNRASVDAYIAANIEVLSKWDKKKPLYTIQDISSPKITLTPYFKQRLSDVTDYVKTHEIKVYTAIVMDEGFTGQLMRIFGRLFTINARYLKQVYFTNMTEARAWIQAQQTEEQSAVSG